MSNKFYFLPIKDSLRYFEKYVSKIPDMLLIMIFCAYTEVLVRRFKSNRLPDI